jgi:hypothetical protein
MTKIDLLTTVQPPDGWFAVVGIKGKKVQQELVATREEVDTLTKELVAANWNVFFGVAKYKTGANRKKDNVLSLKAFWLDIDCGATKAAIDPATGKPGGYIDQDAGLGALKEFCEHIGLPRPLLINSGRGLHAYWTLDKAISRGEWEPVAERLRQLCSANDFYIDNAVFDATRVLRVPDTLNFKDTPPKPVSIISPKTPDPITYEAIRTLLAVKDEPKTLFGATKLKPSMMAMKLRANKTYNFAKIMKRSLGGTGCKQLATAFNESATLGYDLWIAALSVAAACEDRDTAIHKLSKDNPGYDPATVEQKADSFDSDTGANCATFEAKNPGGCDGCPLKGKITGPIALGTEIAEAAEADNTVVEVIPGGEEITYRIPDPPFPFMRGVNGGIYKRPEKGSEEEPELIYPYDFYVVKRLNDPQYRLSVLFRLHIPSDGVKEFVLSNKILTNGAKTKEELASYGVTPEDKHFGLLLYYIKRSVNELQARKKAEEMRAQMGWADNDTVFIIGDREVTRDGIFYSTPSSYTEDWAAKMTPRGTLDAWKEVWQLYGLTGLEPHAFAALTAFGSPLFKFLGHKGAMINLYNSDSGTGKSTVLWMANSVYGEPEGLCLQQKDTKNSAQQILGVFNNLPPTIDEITNWSDDAFSNWMYDFTSGVGKQRMNSDSNTLRKNYTSWACLGLSSSNASFYEKLQLMKEKPQGEMMRFMEYKISMNSPVPTAEGKYMFDQQLKKNYGHAGPLFIQYLVNNKERAEGELLEFQGMVDDALKLTQQERFWSGLIASNLVGGRIAKRIGLIDWKLKPIYDCIGQKVSDMRGDTSPPPEAVTSILATFLMQHWQNALVINGAVDARNPTPPLPMLEPRSELLIRYEPDTKLMFIIPRAFKTFCIDRQINFRDTEDALKSRGILLESKNKRMAKGMKLEIPLTRVMVLDFSIGDLQVALPTMHGPEE